jgi:hypothetical protein
VFIFYLGPPMNFFQAPPLMVTAYIEVVRLPNTHHSLLGVELGVVIGSTLGIALMVDAP